MPTRPARRVSAIVIAAAFSMLACGGKPVDLSLNVAWVFSSGDCASNGVTTVRVSWGAAGAALTDVEFACSAGGGTLGEFAPGGGTYTIKADGLDAAGVARVTHLGTSLNVQASGTDGAPVDLTLRPKPADVVVTWSRGGGGCPAGFVLPYFITLYTAPATPGGPLTSKVQEKQESCSTKKATLTSVAPGAYVVVLDSRAVSPAIRAQRDVSVQPGQDAQVDFQL